MPLIDIDSGKTISKVPYEKDFLAIKNRLTAAEFDAIVSRINELIDASGKEIATAGWLPGRNWAGTVFDPIYQKGANRNEELSARWFGQAVWYTVMNRPEKWGSGRYKVGDRDIGSRTYFRLGDR